MKRIISLLLTLTLMFSSLAVTVSAATFDTSFTPCFSVTTHLYSFPLSVSVAATFSVDPVSPARATNSSLPAALTCHSYVSSAPVAATVKVAVVPYSVVTSRGCFVIFSGVPPHSVATSDSFT